MPIPPRPPAPTRDNQTPPPPDRAPAGPPPPPPAPEPRPAPLPPNLPDYLPARMVNQFVYCPRLFFYEWVDGLFRESADTLEGSAQHKRVDARPSELPKAGAGEEK